MLTYSFIQHPVGRILKNLPQMFPGIQDAYCIFTSYNKDIIVQQFTSGDIEKLVVKTELPLIQKFRKQKQPHNWVKSDMIHFITGAKKSRKKLQQLSFVDEDQNHFLCLKFLSPIDHLYDTIILKIENSSILEMSKSGSQLSAQSKNLIGKLLYQTFKSRIEEEYQNNETHRLVLNNIQIQSNNVNALQTENDTIRANYKKSVLYFINNVMSRMSDKFNMSVALSDKAQEYILDKDLDITSLEKTLIQAAHMAANLTLNYSSTIVIQPENILVNQTEEQVLPITHNDKHAGVIELLDRYETAAETAQAKEWKINGNTVAELCSPSVTPSAITFNLKKYKKSINILLDRYEDKWPLLRNHFKPLKNIVEHQQSELSRFKSA
jgi:hypothetical protein